MMKITKFKNFPLTLWTFITNLLIDIDKLLKSLGISWTVSSSIYLTSSITAKYVNGSLVFSNNDTTCLKFFKSEL